MTMRFSTQASRGERAHGSKRRSLLAVSALGAALLLAGCGGRSANPVSETGNFDLLLSCAHLDAEAQANARRMEDLRDERNTNRLRNLTRVPGAILGNPLSALALADTSRAIYIEIDALEERDKRLEELKAEKQCGAEEGDGFGATLVGGVVGGAAGFLEKAVSVAGGVVDAAGDAANQARDFISGEDKAAEPAADAPAEAATAEGEAAVMDAAAEATPPPVVEDGASAPAQ